MIVAYLPECRIIRTKPTSGTVSSRMRSSQSTHSLSVPFLLPSSGVSSSPEPPPGEDSASLSPSPSPSPSAAPSHSPYSPRRRRTPTPTTKMTPMRRRPCCFQIPSRATTPPPPPTPLPPLLQMSGSGQAARHHHRHCSDFTPRSRVCAWMAAKGKLVGVAPLRLAPAASLATTLSFLPSEARRGLRGREREKRGFGKIN